MEERLSFFKKNFWDFFFMKLFRNIASVKYQWLLFMYIPVVWGMFHFPPGSKQPWVSATTGLTFLAGGFVTLATSRIIARTKLTENSDDKDGVLATDK